MAEMAPRERVWAAIHHQEADRVPTALGGGPYGIVDDLYLKLVQLFGLPGPVAPFRKGHTVSYLDDRIFERLGVDTRYVWPGASPGSPIHPTQEPDIYLDGYGQTWKYAPPYFFPAKGILSEASIDDIDRIVRWPDVSEHRWTAGVRKRAKQLREATDCFVVARMVTSHGPFLTACNLRGTEQFLLDMVLDEAFVLALVERVTDAIDGLLRRYLEAGGGYFDMVELPGDDYANTTNLVMSVEMFRKYFKPALQRLVRSVKAYRSTISVMFHSDGMIAPLLPDLIDIGIDVLHPLEPVPGMDLAAVKTNYGDRLTFLGGIDIAQAMRGSQQDVREEAKRRIGQLGAHGGYILAPANHLQADVPPENVVTLFETAHRYGAYPLALSD